MGAEAAAVELAEQLLLDNFTQLVQNSAARFEGFLTDLLLRKSFEVLELCRIVEYCISLTYCISLMVPSRYGPCIVLMLLFYFLIFQGNRLCLFLPRIT